MNDKLDVKVSRAKETNKPQISLNITLKQVSCLPKSHNSVITNSSGDIEVFIFDITNVWTVSWGKLDISLQKDIVVLETAATVNFKDQIYRDIFVKLISTRELFKPRHRSHPM